MPSCRGLPDGVRRLCEALIERYGQGAAELDRGVPRVDYSKGHQPILQKTGVGEADGVYSTGEVVQAAVAIAQDEFVRNDGSAPILQELRRMLQLEAPLLLDDGDPKTTADTQLVRQLRDGRAPLRNAVAALGLTEGTVAYNTHLATRLLDYLWDPSGLGLRGRPILRQEPLTKAVKRGVLNCVDFTALYYSGALLMGLDPIIVLQYNDGSLHTIGVEDEGITADHVLIAIRVDPNDRGQLLFVDPMSRSVGREGGSIPWVELPPLEFATAYYLNRAELNHSGVKNVKDRLVRKWHDLRKARMLSPNSYAVQLAIGRWHWDNGYLKGAAHHFDQARILNPYFIFANSSGER